mmetsp:Transcript_42144/g.106061  ORF Transcript_42144/g.106061 Transcript_42144/m.106061 type:complete len:290 (-) Transcript_42144:621-1490(-)
MPKGLLLALAVFTSKGKAMATPCNYPGSQCVEATLPSSLAPCASEVATGLLLSACRAARAWLKAGDNLRLVRMSLHSAAAADAASCASQALGELGSRSRPGASAASVRNPPLTTLGCGERPPASVEMQATISRMAAGISASFATRWATRINVSSAKRATSFVPRAAPRQAAKAACAASAQTPPSVLPATSASDASPPSPCSANSTSACSALFAKAGRFDTQRSEMATTSGDVTATPPSAALRTRPERRTFIASRSDDQAGSATPPLSSCSSAAAYASKVTGGRSTARST